MPSPIQSADHYVLRKLADELLPWMVAAKRINNRWFVWLSFFYGYIGDFGAALAGLGIGTPLVALAQGKLPNGSNAFDILRTVLGPSWFYAGVAGLAVWIVVRLVMRRQNVESRTLFAREYARGIKALYPQLYRALAERDPMPQILAIQKTVDDKVQDAIKNEVWPYDPPFPRSSDIEAELKAEVDFMRTTYMAKWGPPPPGAA